MSPRVNISRKNFHPPKPRKNDNIYCAISYIHYIPLILQIPNLPLMHSRKQETTSKRQNCPFRGKKLTVLILKVSETGRQVIVQLLELRSKSRLPFRRLLKFHWPETRKVHNKRLLDYSSPQNDVSDAQTSPQHSWLIGNAHWTNSIQPRLQTVRFVIPINPQWLLKVIWWSHL
jgi:hypothetical protein